MGYVGPKKINIFNKTRLIGLALSNDYLAPYHRNLAHACACAADDTSAVFTTPPLTNEKCPLMKWQNQLQS